MNNHDAKAIVNLAFCDGKNIYTASHELSGTITDKPTGSRTFQWDTIFVPKGYTKSFAEMDILEKKQYISALSCI